MECGLWGIGYGFCLPDTQHNLEALVLGGGKDVLRSVTFCTGVGTDQGSNVLQVVEVGFVVASGLAGTVGILVTERETDGTTGRDEGWGNGQCQRKEARGTHSGKWRRIGRENKG